MKDAASTYVARGFAVFPCRHRSKEPATHNGFKDAVCDTDGIERLWGNRLGLNIGVATGEVSGFFVVDVDGPEGEASLEALEASHSPLPPTLESTTGKGRHLLFAHPGRRVPSSSSKLGPHIDIRGDGGYIVAPPSIHPSGRTYKWVNEAAGIAVAPAWIVDLACREKVRDAPAIDYDGPHREHDAWDQSEVERMLQAIDPDMPYEDWLRVGMALHAGGYSLAVWDQWSRSGDKYEAGCTIRRWMGFKSRPGGVSMGTLVDMAKIHGWRPRDAERDMPLDPKNIGGVDISGLLKPKEVADDSPAPFDPAPIRQEETLTALNQPKSLGVLGFDPLELDGIIGQTVRWIVKSAVKPQPELALMNTLAALGAVFGRRYASPLNTRTNIYIVGIAGTGSGKDQSRRSIKNLLVAANLHRFLGGDSIVSGQGLLYGLKTQPTQLLHLDEFGMLMQAITDQKGAHYMRVVGKVLTELYSSSSSVYHGGTYADSQKEPVVINAPNLCIYGTSTLEKYAEAISRSAIASGELNRFVVLPVTHERPARCREIAGTKPDGSLVAAWEVFQHGPQRGLAAVDNALVLPEALTVWWPGQDDRIHDMGLFEDAMLDQYEGEGTGPLWNRYRENVIKIAMIFAIARAPQTPAIQAVDLDVAEMIVKASIDYMRSMAVNHMADSQHEKDRQEVIKTVRLSGGSMNRRELARSIRHLNKRSLDEVLSALIEAGSIEATEGDSTGGRRPVVYKTI